MFIGRKQCGKHIQLVIRENAVHKIQNENRIETQRKKEKNNVDNEKKNKNTNVFFFHHRSFCSRLALIYSFQYDAVHSSPIQLITIKYEFQVDDVFFFVLFFFQSPIFPLVFRFQLVTISYTDFGLESERDRKRNHRRGFFIRFITIS